MRMSVCCGLAAMAMTLGAFLFTGCEEADSTRALVVEPPFADLTLATTNNPDTQTFTVSTNGLGALSLPLEWSVSNPDLGRIAPAGGLSASYVRTSGARGDNGIFVKDQYGAEGVATVRQ